MTSSGWSASPGREVPFQAQGSGYGIPTDRAIAAGPDGSVTVKIRADLADRFNKLVRKSPAGGVAANIDTETHKAGLEPLTERVRDLTAVAEAKAQTGGTAETRTPDIGFPSGAEGHGRP